MPYNIAHHPALEVRNLYKRFPGVIALNGVNLVLYPGRIHALLGQNGAGKSTLIEILSGRLKPDSGEIRLNGKPVAFGSVTASLNAGIAVVHQELSLVEGLSVAENLVLNRPEFYRTGLWRRHQAEQAAAAFMRCFPGMEEIPPTARVSQLSVAQRQLVEIARALMRNSHILILDEPTSSLSEREIDALFRLLKHLRDEGHSILLVTHKLDEVFRIADHVTVLRDGKEVLFHVPVDKKLTEETIVEAMIGRHLDALFPKRERLYHGPPVLEVKDLVVRPGAPPFSFTIRCGEIVALVGLVGSGRTSLLRVLAGVDRPIAGEVRVMGNAVELSSPAAAIAAGIILVPEDRKQQGLVLDLSVTANLSLPKLARGSGYNLVRARQERLLYRRAVDSLQIKVDDPAEPVAHLSGGNQQKVVIGKWLVLDTARVVLMDEPTKGIDIAAKADVYQLVAELASTGLAVLINPSEMDEALQLSDRIFVIARNQIIQEVDPSRSSKHELYRIAADLRNNYDTKWIDN